MVDQSVALGRLRVLPVELGPRPFFALRHKERYASKASEALLAMAGQHDEKDKRSTSKPAGARR